MKHNINKNKLNYRDVETRTWYSKKKEAWIIEYFFTTYLGSYFRKPRNHRNKIYAKNHKRVVDNYDDIKISRNYRSWKDRTKRKHQYKNEDVDDFRIIKESGNI